MRLRLVALAFFIIPLAEGASHPMTQASTIHRVPSAAPQGTTPALGWQDVSSVRVLCLAAPDTLPGRRDVQAALCDRVAALAADGAPMAVTPVGFGDPTVLERNTVTLLVHASVEAVGPGRTLLFSLRAFRNAGVETETLFGAAPRAVHLGGSVIAGPALDAAIRAALAEVVPWKQGRAN